MVRRGFTIVEIIITITIMGILMLLAVVNLNATQASARDSERIADVDTIKLNLESFYTAGAASNATIPTVTNLSTNPSFETGVTNWSASCGSPTLTRDTTQYYSGTASGRLDTTAASQCMYGAMINSGAGRTYNMSVFVKGSGVIQLTINAQPGSVILVTSPMVTLSNTWQRINVTATTGAGITQVYPVIYQRTSGTNSVYADAVMSIEAPYTPNYGDGSTTGWSWTSTPHVSTSTGPVIKVGAPGTYPSVSLTSPTLITVNLSDADLKSFTAPGQTDPYATFIAATNAVQTTTGVLPQPTTSQYVYQPIDSTGNLCYNYSCRKYNIYYRLEKDNTVYMTTSKNQ